MRSVFYYVALCEQCNLALAHIDERSDWEAVKAFIFDWKAQGYTLQRVHWSKVKQCECEKIEVTTKSLASV